jgi:hypothetical protein
LTKSKQLDLPAMTTNKISDCNQEALCSWNSAFFCTCVPPYPNRHLS